MHKGWLEVKSWTLHVQSKTDCGLWPTSITFVLKVKGNFSWDRKIKNRSNLQINTHLELVLHQYFLMKMMIKLFLHPRVEHSDYMMFFFLQNSSYYLSWLNGLCKTYCHFAGASNFDWKTLCLVLVLFWNKFAFGQLLYLIIKLTNYSGNRTCTLRVYGIYKKIRNKLLLHEEDRSK